MPHRIFASPSGQTSSSANPHIELPASHPVAEPGDSVHARIERSAGNRMDPAAAATLLWQADAMMATDVTRSFDGDWAAAAEAVQADVLILVGSSDHVVTPGPAEAFARHLGDRATLVVFENDCGHDIPGCEMFRSRSLIREFLRLPP